MDAARVTLRTCLINGDCTIAIINPTAAEIEGMVAPQFVARAAGAVGEPAQLEMVSGGMGAIGAIPWFDITNGDVRAARPIFVRASITVPYHWCPIVGLPRAAVMANSDLFIKVALARLAMHPVAALTPDQTRKVGLVLGMARAVMTSYYGVEENYLVPGERAAPVIRYQPALTGDNASPAAFTMAAGLPIAAIDILRADLNLTDVEKEALSQVLMCAIGVPALQGLSLVTVIHHYLSGNPDGSRKAFDVVEKQFWSVSSQRAWFTGDQEIMRDAMWHKAGHPILPRTKMDWAMDTSVRQMLIAAGAGAAAARLPAEEPDVRSGNTCLTLCRTVQPLFESYEGELSYAPLERALDYVASFRPGRTVGERPAGMPPSITSRETAVAHLSALLKANEGVFALVFGFYSAQVDNDAMTSADEVPDTLVKAHSLTRLKRNSPGAFRAGMISYKDYLSARTKAREAGLYAAARVRVAEVENVGPA